MNSYCAIDGILLWAMLPDIPVMPQHVVDDILGKTETNTTERTYHARGQVVSESKLVTHDMSPIVNLGFEWVREHIDADAKSVWRADFPGDSKKVPAHTDARREHGVNCIFTTGSLQPVKTQFYKPRGSKELALSQKGLWFIDESELEVIEEVEFPLSKWWYINTRVIHGTNLANLTSVRSTCGIGYNNALGTNVQQMLDPIYKRIKL